MEINQALMQHDLDHGVITGEVVETSKKLYKDAKNFYESVDTSLDDNTLMYEVYFYSGGKEDALNYGLTVMQPVKVNGECNMTRGHFHLNTKRDEIYVGMEGNGLLLYMDSNDYCWAEEVHRGSVHYIDGEFAHRLINTGDTVMKVQCFWPCDSGHDYARVEEHPFTKRVYVEDNKIVVK